MDVSVIIVNYNTCSLILQCIDSIYSKTRDLFFEIIVVDNASSDDSILRIKERFPNVCIIESPQNLGFGRANNLGSQYAKGNYLFFLNPDTILVNNAIKILFDYMSSHLSVGISGGNLYDKEMNNIHSYSLFFPSLFWELNILTGRLLEHLRYGKKSLYNATSDVLLVGYITGADLMINKKLFNEIGRFSPDFFMYYEETELAYRVKKLSLQVVNNPLAHIIHLVGQSSSSEHKLRMFLKGRRIFMEKCYSLWYNCFANFVFRLTCISRIIIYAFSERKRIWLSVLNIFNQVSL